MSKLFSYQSVAFKDGFLSKNGSPVAQFSGNTHDDVLKEAYQFLRKPYPKFFKMDRPSKLVFIAAELLMDGLPWLSQIPGDKIGVLLQSAAGCADTDSSYAATIDPSGNYFPSPGLFVYTLPNIAIGELCIRHGFTGENLLMIGEKSNRNAASHVMAEWLAGKATEVCIFGWFNVDSQTIEAELHIVGPDHTKSVLPFS